MGTTASFTNRGRSAKRLVKNGKAAATIALQLRNVGPDAYKPEEYGSSITITRRISATGGSSYKFLSSGGVVISQKSSEMQGILEQFNIQIKNPCCILMQETSKNFLFSNNSKSKYHVFFGFLVNCLVLFDGNAVGED